MSDLDDFRARVREFLDAHAERRPHGTAPKWGEGEDRLSGFTTHTDEEEKAETAAARAWRRELFDAGFGWLTGPVEYGGAGLGPEYQEAYDELAADYRIPGQRCFVVGLGIVGPTIAGHADHAIKERYLAPLHRADLMACQLFSEPEAGSDLAGVRTRAVREEGGWRVTGQKVWTSGAHYSDIGELLVRTDPEAPKHRGLTIMIVDMHDPAIEVRPLRQITGNADFNEVFIDGLFVPDSHVVGEPGTGWRVATSTLSTERRTMSRGGNTRDYDPLPRLQAAARALGRTDAATRLQLAELTVLSRVVAATTRALAADEERAAYAPALGKLLMTDYLLRLRSVADHVIGPGIVADTGEWGTWAWHELTVRVMSQRIAGGTDEILKNIVSERMLGLPRG
ncbi:acyl-CoA dehydrogenase family protein [Pseudonocardia ailaonensis]|uniref:Acyl-CoA dehydrogenase family protein n=1 Tax=Pseudonocardia ailaonensis TaxID=367279 RepID=A0ABN2N3D8_9PSEU